MVKNINGDIYSDVITRSNDNAMPSSSRGGFVPEFIVIHHMATTSFEGGMATWYGGGTSANYAVSDTEIVGCVGENYSAWHAGGTSAYDIPNISNINARSIGIEHVNSTGAPSWQVSDATIRNSAKLVADICKRYNIPITRDRIKRHGEITKTQCCGGLDIDKLVKYAQDIANGVQQNNYLIKKGDKKMTIVFSYKGVGYSAIDGTMIAFTENKYWDKVNSIASKNGTLSDLGEISEAQYNQFVKAYKFGK
jgi:N-acetylmuramoyl-L-alanine amidase CwlA